MNATLQAFVGLAPSASTLPAPSNVNARLEHNPIRTPVSSVRHYCDAPSTTIVQAILSVNHPQKIVSARSPMSAPTADVSSYSTDKLSHLKTAGNETHSPHCPCSPARELSVRVS